MAKNDFQYGGWNYYILQCGTIMTLIRHLGSLRQNGKNSIFSKTKQFRAMVSIDDL